MKRYSSNPLSIVLLLSLLLSVFFFSVETRETNSEENSAIRLVPVEWLRSDEREEHVFLDPQESLTFSAFEEVDGLRFVKIDVLIDSPNASFLREIDSDLYIESYDYFGSLGAWTPNSNFTITNPTGERQEVFLKIVRNYLQTAYAVDTIVGKEHTIEFTSGPAADRVFLRWRVYAALKYVEANQSEVYFSSVNRTQNPVIVEFLPHYLSFQLPRSQRISRTHFVVRLEEREMEPPSGYCYVSALLLRHEEITLGALEEFTFDLPEVNGWNYLATAAYTNLTVSLYPEPYPFQLINLAVWEPEENPLLLTAVDTTFGIRNLSNESYKIGFDIAYYYWQNQTGLAFSHEIVGSDSESIVHEVVANVFDANVGADLGLTGQYLQFLVPGKTMGFEAPDPVGKYENSYIPLRQGSYTLVTEEKRIVANIKSNVNDLLLSNTLSLRVTYNGDAYANAEVNVNQRGAFTNRTYKAFTDQNGEAKITIHSNGPELNQLSLTVSKDEFNYVEQTIDYTVGTSWYVITVLAFIAVTVFIILYLRKRRKKLQTQT
jgi:hypothetical protein